jgi:hypothetical protein
VRRQPDDRARAYGIGTLPDATGVWPGDGATVSSQDVAPSSPTSSELCRWNSPVKLRVAVEAG